MSPDDKHLSAVPNGSDIDDDYYLGLSHGDYFLRWLLALVNLEPDLRITLSVDVGGATYSGTVISRREYAERIRESIGQAGLADGLAEKLNAPFAKMLEVEDGIAPGGAYPPDLASEINRASYVHLVDYTIVQGVQPSDEITTGVWRGSVESVVGWTTTSFKASQQ